MFDERDSGGDVVLGANWVSLLKGVFSVTRILPAFYTVVYICCILQRKAYCSQG